MIFVAAVLAAAASLDLLHDVLTGVEVDPLELLAAALLLVLLPFGGAAGVGDEEKSDEENCKLGHFGIDG